MIKRIQIEVDSTEDNKKIESYLRKWIVENFQKYQSAKLEIDNVFFCSECKENELIGVPVNMPTQEYYCHFCNKSFKKEDIEK